MIFSIIVNVVVLVFLARFAQTGSFAWVDGSGFFENPVISQYLPLIALSSLVEIVVEIVVLWQGRWQIVTRLASVLVNLFSLVVVIVLLQGHDAWLAAQGVGGLLTSIADIPALIIARSPLAGMVTFRVGLVFALVVIAWETHLGAVPVRSRPGAGAAGPQRPRGHPPRTNKIYPDSLLLWRGFSPTSEKPATKSSQSDNLQSAITPAPGGRAPGTWPPPRCQSRR